MRVRDEIEILAPAAVRATGLAHAVQTAPAAAPAAAPVARPSLDVVTIMGVLEADLTPKVRVALDKLLTEGRTLRRNLERARRRIEFLEQLADRDPLAPVLNRRAFVRELTRAIAFAERYGVLGSLIYVDINGMKRINDRHGHGAGDAALRHVAEVLLRDVRASDVVGRLGGDEFGIILAQASGHDAAAKAAALAKAIEGAPVTWQDTTLELRVSYGAYTFAGGEGVDEALSAADRAMYAHKQGAA